MTTSGHRLLLPVGSLGSRPVIGGPGAVLHCPQMWERPGEQGAGASASSSGSQAVPQGQTTSQPWEGGSEAAWLK